MALATHHQANLDTIIEAAGHGDLAVLEARRRRDGQTVALLCAVGFDDGEYLITPFAELADGNPFELYDPPDPESGFVGPCEGCGLMPDDHPDAGCPADLTGGGS